MPTTLAPEASIPQVIPTFYYVGEVAAHVRRSEKAIRWHIHTGRLQTTRMAGRVVVTEEQLAAFLASE